MLEETQTAGTLLRAWRQRRRLSQLALALELGMSQRHLSFLESGRAHPSRHMLLRLMEQLAVPLRQRNVILGAAGFAPLYSHRPLDAPDLAPAREVIERILQGHAPHPALAVDRHWTLLSANAAVAPLLTGAADHLLSGEVNVLRLSLHPAGLASRILNFREWRAHILARLAHDLEVSADSQLSSLLEELESFPIPAHAEARRGGPVSENRIAIPLRLASGEGPLNFISTTTVFGTAVDVTLSEVTIETFFPADSQTGAAMEKLMAQEATSDHSAHTRRGDPGY